MKIKKLNLKQAKYILPLILLIPLLFLIYNIKGIFSSSDNEKKGVVTDSINASLPQADSNPLQNKLKEMEDAEYNTDDSHTAIAHVGKGETHKEDIDQGYTKGELDAIDQYNAERKAAEQREEEAYRRRQLANKHHNAYDDAPTAQNEQIRQYTEAINAYRNPTTTTRERQAISQGQNNPTISSSTSPQEKVNVVHKVQSSNLQHFNTINSPKEEADQNLIKAIIDQTTKARNGTRIRFKLLDDVTLQQHILKKGTYLYGLVTGFNQQRVLVNITSILVQDKFLKVNLSVYDYDGMEGFYVPASLFRNMMKDATAQSLSNNMNMGGMNTSELNAEAMALQTLQNVYSSASSAISSHIREQKAKIKYNTIVYLINTNTSNQ